MCPHRRHFACVSVSVISFRLCYYNHIVVYMRCSGYVRRLYSLMVFVLFLLGLLQVAWLVRSKVFLRLLRVLLWLLL